MHYVGFVPSFSSFSAWRRYVRLASSVPVPELMIKHFRPENRGEEFPRGIPYEPLAETLKDLHE